MSKLIAQPVRFRAVLGLILMLGAGASADWSETFDNMTFDQVWTWGCCPDVTKTFTHVPADGPGTNDYLSMDETTKYDTGAGSYGSAFGIGFCTHEVFSDVRVGTVVNVASDAASFYHGIGARADHFIDPTGATTGAPGIWADAYIMHINWEEWPPEFSIDVEKVIGNYQMMDEDHGAMVPGLDNGGSFYAALDVIGSNPTYVTGYLYEYEGGPLVAKTPTIIDTDVLDTWENEAHDWRTPHNGPFLTGYSGIFAQNEDSYPVGYHTTFDDVSSASGGAKGPVAVCLSPADGGTGVDIDADLDWVEAASTTSRELWFGKEGAMRLLSPADTTYDPGTLELGQTYQWRVDQIGAGGTTEGPVFSFTTEGTSDGCLTIDDFESYNSHAEIQAPDAWPDDIGMTQYKYTFLETFEVYAGAKTMRFEYQNQYEPYITRAVHTFAEPEDWTKGGLAVLSLHFRGDDGNIEQPFSIELEDNLGHSYGVANPHSYAPLTELWQKWSIELSEFGDNGVDLAAVKKISIRTGSGTNTGQPLEAIDVLYIDDIKVCPLKCTMNSNADLDGDCRIGFGDFSAIANEWLSEGEYVLP